MVPPKKMPPLPQIPPPSARVAALVLKWILDEKAKWDIWMNQPQPKPPASGPMANDADRAALMLYANQLIAAGVIAAA